MVAWSRVQAATISPGTCPGLGFLGGRRPPYAAGGDSTVEYMIATLRRA